MRLTTHRNFLKKLLYAVNELQHWQQKNGVPVPSEMGEAKQKRLNLQTYKYHALGDYPNTIQM